MTTDTNTKRPITSLSGPALPFWRRIRWNLILYFVLLAVVPVALIVSLVITQLQQKAQQQALNQLASVATLKTQLIDQWLSDSQAVLYTMAASDAEDKRFSVLTTPRVFDFERNQTIVNSILLAGTKGTNTFSEIFFYDLDGAIQASSDPNTMGKVVTRQPYFTPSLADQYIQSPYYEVGSGQLTALVTYPVRNINGQIIGVLAGRLNLDVLSQVMLQRTGLTGSGETYLVSAQSNYLLTPSRFEGYEQTRAYHSQGIDKGLAGEDGSGVYDDYREPSVRVFGVYRWIPQLQAALLAEQDEADALSAFNEARLNGLLLTIGGALLAVLAGLYAATRFSQPILALTDTATRIAIGDLNERATVRQRNELGVLGAAFNDMADQLQLSISSLEDRVANRTRDLSLTLEVGQLATRVYQQTDLLPHVADFIRERFDLYYTQIYLIDDVKRYAVLAAGTGEVGEQLLDRRHRLDLDQTSIVARTVQTRRPVLVADTENSSIHRPNPLLPETRSEVAIPLIAGDEVIGVLDMQARTAETFREDNLPVFEAMASQLASAVRGAQAYAETRTAVDRADAINRRLTGEAWTSYLGRLGQGESVGYEYDLQRVTRLATDSTVEPTSGNGQDHQLALPVALRGQSIGTIQVEEADRAREWTEEEVGLVKDVADRVALALEQFRAFDETQVALSETEEQAQRLADLNEMAAQLSAAASLNDVYRIVAIWTNRVLHGERSSLALFTPERDSFEIFGLDGVQGAIPLGATLPREGSWIGQVVDGQRVRRLDDLRREPYPETRQLAAQGLCSSLNIPLAVGNEIIGTLNVASPQPHAFGPRDEGLLQQIASLLTSHLQTQQLFAQTQKRAAEMEAVARVGAEASATLDPNALLWSVSDLVKERFDLYHVHIYLADAARALLLTAGAGEAGRSMVSQGHRIALTHQHSLVARAARTGTGVIANDVTQAPDFLPNPMLPDTRSELAVPMIVGDQLIGVLDVQSSRAEYFTADDQQVFSTLASQIAVAVQNARQFEQTQLRVRDLQVINQVSEYLRGGEDLESTLERIVETVLDALGGDNATIALFDHQTQIWHGMAGAGEGITTELAKSLSDPAEVYPHGLEAVRTGQPVVVNDVRTYPGFPAQFIESLGIKSVLAMPVLGDETSTGVLFMNFTQRQRTFAPEELALAQGIADQIAVGYGAKQAESNLAEREQLMRTIIDTTPDWIFAKDTDYRYLLVNKAFAEFYGRRTPEEMIGKDDYDLGTPAELVEGDPERGIVGFRTDDRAVIVDKQRIHNPHDVVNFADGTEHVFDTSKLPLHDVEGRIVGVLGFSHDITEQLQAQEERERLLEDLQRVSIRLQERLKEISALQEIGAYSDENLELDEYLDRVVRRIPPSMLHPDICAAAIEFEGRLYGDKVAVDTPWKLVVPLQISGEQVGTISVGYVEEREFAPEETPHIESVAERVETYIQSRRLFEQVQKRAAEMQAVSEVGAEASATLDPTELLRNVANLAKGRFGLYHAHIYLLDETGDNLILAAGAGSIGEMMVNAGHRIATGHERSLVARAARQRRGVIVNDVASAPDFLPNPMLPATRAELAIPMIVGDQVIGVLDVQSDEINHFMDEDLRVQSTLASQVAVAVNNARLFEQTQRRAAEMQAVAEVGAEASATLDQQSLLWNVTNLVKDRFDLYHAHVYLMDDNAQSLVLTAGAGEPGRLMVSGGHRIPLRHEQSLVVRAARTRQSVVVNDVTRAPDFLPNPMLPKTRAELATPLVVGGRVIGVLDVQSERVNRFSAEDVQVQSTLASQIAVAVNNAQLFAEQLEVADRLREVDRLKSEFLASMSHELRTPLNSIIGYAEVLLDGIDGELSDDMNEDVGAIHGSGKHLLNLINDILDLAKIEAGQMDLVMEAFELRPLAEDTANIQLVLLKDKPVDLVVDIPDDLPQVHADPLRVRQVIGNLITNAIKFTEQGSITIRAREYEPNPALIQISVIDTGMGMRQDQLQVIFDRFRQVDQSHTRRAGGTGLGLSITRQLVQMHGGDIKVESEPGVGSAFHFTLPAALETAER